MKSNHPCSVEFGKEKKLSIIPSLSNNNQVQEDSGARPILDLSLLNIISFITDLFLKVLFMHLCECIPRVRGAHKARRRLPEAEVTGGYEPNDVGTRTELRSFGGAWAGGSWSVAHSSLLSVVPFLSLS